MNENLLSVLKEKIDILSALVERMNLDLNQKNAELTSMSVEMNNIKSQLDIKKLEVARIQSKINEKVKISNEAQSALNKILDNTQKLLQAVDVESSK